MKKLFVFIILIFSMELNSETIFDDCDWKEAVDSGRVNLYWVDAGYPCFYKAETVLDIRYYDMVKRILADFERYPEIFSGTVKFDVVKRNNDVFLIYCLIDFFPMKNRDYMINARFFEEVDGDKNNKWTLLWYPVDTHDEKEYLKNSKFKHVKEVNGRWMVKKINNEKISVSVEYYNDWEVEADKDIKIHIEKNATINAMKNLLKHLN